MEKTRVTIESDGREIYSVELGRSTTVDELQALSAEDDGLFAYAVLKNSRRSLELSDEVYELYIAVFFRILESAVEKAEIMEDVLEMDMERMLDIGLANALIEAAVCRIERGESVCNYRRFVWRLCGRMSSTLFQGAFCRSLGDLENMRLDFMILSLKLIWMLVQDGALRGEEMDKSMFSFAKSYFYECLEHLGQQPELEADLVFVFKTAFAIDALATGHVVDRLGETFSIAGDLVISEDNLFRIYVQMCSVGRVCSDAFGEMLFLVFATDCLVQLEQGHRNSLVDMILDMAEDNGVGERMTETFRKIFHSLRDSESGNRDALVCNFLSFLSRLSVRDAGEISSIFLKFVVRHPGVVELYSDFILLNGADIPLHSLHQSSSFGFMQKFYAVLFNKVRREKHSIAHVDRLVVDFFKFFLTTKNRDLAKILPLVPYIPTKRETLHALYEIYAFLFEKDAIDSVGPFLLKTPALVGISSSIYYNVKYFPHLATRLNLIDVNAQRLVFLGIVYHCESKKIHNFNYTGILEYIEDEDTIRTCREGLIHVVGLIHSNYVSRSYEFTLSYVNALFAAALKPRTTETTLTIVQLILRLILEGEDKIIFIKEIHQRFQELFVLFRSRRFLSVGVVESYTALYRHVLEMIRCAPNFFNYVVLCIADLSFFDGEFQKNQFKSFNDLYSHTLSRMSVIEEFPEIFLREDLDNARMETGSEELESTDSGMREESEISSLGFLREREMMDSREELGISREPAGSHDVYSMIHAGVSDSMMSLAMSMGNISLHRSSSTSIHSVDIGLLSRGIRRREQSVSWLIDIIYTRRSQSSVIRAVLDLLKQRLETMFEYEDLYILLKAYNILLIRENDSEAFLKKALHKGLDFKSDPVVCHKLSVETSGFYRFFFKTLYFAVSECAAEVFSFPEKDQLVSRFSSTDLIMIQNTFRHRVTEKMLAKTNTPSYRSYFFNTDSLGIVDCLAVIKRVEDPFVVARALERLRLFRKEVFFYVPQLVQALRRESVLEDVLVTLKDLAQNEAVSHQLIWNLKANLYRDGRKKVRDRCYDVFRRCMQEIMDGMPEESREAFLREEEFVDELTKISRSLLPHLRLSKDEKRRRINEHLARIRIHPGMYIPYNPNHKVLEVVGGSARVLQSHAKVPFMASFKVQDRNGSTSIKQLIFKFGDDCRQDMLALQLISMFRTIFRQANLDIFLYPYRVIATDTGCGIIEVIPNSKSRDQIGRENINNLSEYFEYKFGFKESESYISALCNFASSLAGYSLVVYFLNIKDRHNGNIMIDDKGRLIHIDFGYMLETSPGNLNIEAPLKLTKEIEELLGGVSGKGFKIYQELMVKGFLALRRRSKDLVMVVDSFIESELSCYRSNAVENFLLRFRLELSDKSARAFILSLIAESSQKFRTWMYDQYQKLTNNIAF